MTGVFYFFGLCILACIPIGIGVMILDALGLLPDAKDRVEAPGKRNRHDP